MTEPATAPPADPPAMPALGNTPASPANPADMRTDEFADYPRDQWDRPLIAVPGPDGKPVPNPITGQTDRYGTPILWVSEAHTRASTAGSALEHEGGINSWKIRQAVIGFILRPDLFALAQTVEDPGAGGRSELDKHVKAAQDAAGSGAAANRGTASHAFAEREDRGITLPPLDKDAAGWMAAYRTLTAGWRWEHIEARLVCTSLRMAGRTDRIGRPAGWMITPDGQIIGPDDRVVVDLKTSSSSKYFGVKFAVQLAVYAWGQLYDPATGLFTPTGARTDWALVLHIPSGATTGSWWWVNVRAGYELAGLANEVLGARKRKDVVAMVGQVYPTLEAALAAGGVRQAPAADVFTPAPAAEDAPEPAAEPDPAVVAARAEVERLEAEVAAARGPARVEPSNPATWSPTLGPDLQAAHEARQDPEAQRRREILAVASAPPRGGLEAVRQRYALSWTPEHEAAMERRGWELGILAALERSTTVDNLVAVHTLCVGWNAWTDEFERVAARRAAEITKGDG